MEIRKHDLNDLRDIWASWTPKRKDQFSTKYGQIGSLINAAVDEPMLKVMVRFWRN